MAELAYMEINGLLYPDIKIDDEELLNDLGKYGELRLKYLYEHKPKVYSELLIMGKLAQHCTEISKVAFERSEQIQLAYLEAHSISTEDFWERM